MKAPVRMLTMLRRMANHRVSVAALIEAAVWLTIPYLFAGLALAFTHPDRVSQVQYQMQARIPQSAEFELVAFGVATVLWPALLVPPVSCPQSPRAAAHTAAPIPGAA